jgi:toxin FitB
VILLDTTVVSETMRPFPAPEVIAWLDAQAAETLYLSSVALGELLLGIAILPDGKRKEALGAALQRQVSTLFQDRVFDFDVAAAGGYAAAVGAARRSGVTISVVDGQIAAIAISRKCIVATRDVKPFEAAGARTTDPWRTP